MRKYIALIAQLYLEKVKNHRGKRRILKLLGFISDGEMVKTSYGFSIESRFLDNTYLLSLSRNNIELERLISEVPHQGCFIDIGANNGFFTLLAAKTLGREGLILSFEPQRKLFASIVRCAEANKFSNVHVFNIAVSDRCSSISMSQNKSHSGSSRLTIDGKAIDESWSANIDEDMLLIPKMIGKRNILIKIDVEGHEYNALKGIMGIIKSGKVYKILIEINETNLNKYGSTSSKIYEIMKNNGFYHIYGLGYSDHYDEVFFSSGPNL